MSGVGNTYKINPLNGDNYMALWQRLKWILDDLDLWDITMGAELILMPADSAAVIAPEKQAICKCAMHLLSHHAPTGA